MEALIESLKLSGLIVGTLLALALVAYLGDRYADFRFHRDLDPVETHHDFDDWRDPIRDFRAEQYIRSIRRRFAVAAVCGADPENGEGRPVERPTLSRTHGGNHESLHQQ